MRRRFQNLLALKQLLPKVLAVHEQNVENHIQYLRFLAISRTAPARHLARSNDAVYLAGKAEVRAMSASNFSVVYGFGGSSLFDNPLVHFYDGNQLVLAYVARQALMDYFHIPGDRKINTDRWSQVVEENLELFSRLIVEKYERKDWDVHDSYGQNYPLILITLEDMQRSAGCLSANGLNLESANQPTAA